MEGGRLREKDGRRGERDGGGLREGESQNGKATNLTRIRLSLLL